MRALVGLVLVACVATPVATPSLARPTGSAAASSSAPTPSAIVAPPAGSPAVSRSPSPDAAYGWLVVTNSAALSWKVRRENDATAIATFSGDWASVSPDGRSIAFWAPAGVRTQLRVMPAIGGPERTIVTLPSGERGETFAWSTTGTGLAFGVDANTILHGGIDPPPAFSAIRTVDLRTGETRELVRRDETRLRPFGWVRERKLVVAAEFGGLGRTTAYLRVAEDGAISRDAFGTSASADCTHVTALRLDTEATTVMAIQPQTCSTGPATLAGSSLVRVWPIDQGPAQAEILDLGPVLLIDAVFRPGTREVVTATLSGTTLTIRSWQGRSSREVTSVGLASPFLQLNPILARPNGPVILVYWPTQTASGSFTGRLIDTATGGVTDFELGSDRPVAAVYLGP